MFVWMDLIPILITLLVLVLCIWGAVRAAATGGKVASGATGAVFVAVLVLFFVRIRCPAQTADYVTSGEMRVVGEKLCPKADVERWVSATIAFWTPLYLPSSTANLPNVTRGKLLACVDQEKLTAWGRYVRGYTDGQVIVLGNKPGDPCYKVKLFVHELSHLCLGSIGVPWIEERHHAIFDQEKVSKVVDGICPRR